jgi:putative membrane protein
MDRDDITAAVKDVEKRTSGEIVPMVVSSSSGYPAAAFLATLVLSLCLGVIAASAAMQSDLLYSLLNNHITVPAFQRMLSLLVFLAVFLPALPAFRALVAAAPVIKKVFLSRAEMREQVDETAVAAFRRHNLDKTRERNGVLIFISVFERKVKIIADRGINEKVSPGEWQAIADALSSKIRKGSPSAAIIEAVRRCGELLSKNFPVKPGDRDELENLIVEK